MCKDILYTYHFGILVPILTFLIKHVLFETWSSKNKSFSLSFIILCVWYTCSLEFIIFLNIDFLNITRVSEKLEEVFDVGADSILHSDTIAKNKFLLNPFIKNYILIYIWSTRCMYMKTSNQNNCLKYWSFHWYLQGSFKTVVASSSSSSASPGSLFFSEVATKSCSNLSTKKKLFVCSIILELG